MRIIAEGTICNWAEDHERAASTLREWVKVVRCAQWGSFAQLRRTFPSADLVKVHSGRNVVVFNINGNHFRLLCAVHFNTRMVFDLRFLTRADYSKATWKQAL